MKTKDRKGITINLEEEDYRRLRYVAGRECLSMNELARRAIKNDLDGYYEVHNLTQ